MKKLRTLIRLCKQNVDNCHVLLASIEARKASILSAIEEIEVQRTYEQEIAAGHVAFQSAYANYAARSILERDQLEAERSATEIELGAVRDALAAAFAEMKKFEFAMEIRVQKQHRQRTLRQAKAMDEIGALNRNKLKIL